MFRLTTFNRQFTYVNHTLEPWFPTPVRLGVVASPRGLATRVASEATLSPGLHTPPLPAAHARLGYRWQNTGSSSFSNKHATSCRTAGSRVALLQPRPPRTARETFASSSSRLSNVGCPTRLGGCQYRPFSQAFTIRAWSRRTLWCTDGPLMAAQFTASREAAPAAIAAVICFASGAG